MRFPALAIANRNQSIRDAETDQISFVFGDFQVEIADRAVPEPGCRQDIPDRERCRQTARSSKFLPGGVVVTVLRASRSPGVIRLGAIIGAVERPVGDLNDGLSWREGLRPFID